MTTKPKNHKQTKNKPIIFLKRTISRCHNAMKLGMVNRLKIVNRLILHNLPRNITHHITTDKTTTKNDISKSGVREWKRAQFNLE